MQFNEKEFNKYRKEHLEERFWQALRNYMGVGYIFLGESDNEIPERQVLKDTFYIKDEGQKVKKKV
jgi:hypothetical protein